MIDTLLEVEVALMADQTWPHDIGPVILGLIRWVDKLAAERDRMRTAVDAALKLHQEHISVRGDLPDACLCIGCAMARALAIELARNGVRCQLRDEIAAAIDHGLRDDTDGGLLAPDAEMPASEAIRLATDAVLPVVKRHIDAAREQVAEQIAQAIDTAVKQRLQHADVAYIDAGGIARQFAKRDAEWDTQP